MDILDEILASLRDEDYVMLATIIATTGSTPASALSKMLVKQGGIVSVGTVGGGCMEGEVLLKAHRLYESRKAEVVTFHLNEDDLEHGLICGGSLDILIEPVAREHIPLFTELKALRDEGKDCAVATFLGSGGKMMFKELLRPSTDEQDLGRRLHQLIADIRPVGSPPEGAALDDLVEEIRKARHRNETRRIHMPEGELFIEPVMGNPELIIFGGGHISKFLSMAAAMTGFRVTIVDDRPKYAYPHRFPEATRTITADYPDSFEQLSITSSTYIVIVTRGHRYDEVVLEQALHTEAGYIGMIGSKRKVLTTYKHLLNRGIAEDKLKRVHAPIGVDIGAVTAQEIAISIVAELIHARRNAGLPLAHMSDSMPDLEKTIRETTRGHNQA